MKHLLKASNRILWLVPLALIVLLVIIAFSGIMSQLPAPGFLPGEGQMVSARGRLGIQFQQPMRRAEVEQRVRLQPDAAVDMTWEQNTLWLQPNNALPEGQVVTLRLVDGAHSEDGRVIIRPIEWRFTIRQPALAYLSTSNSIPTLWRVNLDGSGAYQLSHAGAQIIDFSPAFDGARLAYSAANDLHGTDLWLVDRDGKNHQRMIACGAENCSSPTWSPDGQQIAFSRKSAPDAFARIWLVQIASGESAPLFQDSAIYGSVALWSPDGRRISIYDPAWKTIRILNRETNQSMPIYTDVQTAGSWSSDGRQFFYVDLDKSTLPPRGMAYQLEVGSLVVTPLFASGAADMDYSLPVQSPEGKSFLAGRRLLGGSHSIQLWLLDADASQEQVISADFLTTRGAYSWDASGSGLFTSNWRWVLPVRSQS